MVIDTFDVATGAWALLVVALAHLLLLRGWIRSLFDPAAYVAVSTTFAISLTFAISGFDVLTMRVAIAVATFWAGYVTMLAYARPRAKAYTDATAETQSRQWAHLTNVVALLAVTYLLANVYLWTTAGIPALVENVDLAKSEGFAGGLGFVRRINWGAGVFVVMGLTLWVVRSGNVVVVLLYTAVLVVMALSGSKSALLPPLFALALVINHRSQIVSPKRLRRLRVLLLTLAASATVVGVLLLVTGEDADLSRRATALIIRLFYFGDVMLYWSDPAIRQYFSVLGPTDYIASVLNPVLGALRLVDYQIPLGNLMVQQSLGLGESLSESLGPNTPFYVKGEIFFGPFVAPLYALMVGIVAGAIRRSFERGSLKRPLAFCVLGTLVLMTPALPTEDSLFVTVVFDMFCLVVPAMLILAPATYLRVQTRRDLADNEVSEDPAPLARH